MKKENKINNFKTIKISPELHYIIKQYCLDNSYKMNNWIEKQLNNKINEICHQK